MVDFTKEPPAICGDNRDAIQEEKVLELEPDADLAQHVHSLRQKSMHQKCLTQMNLFLIG